MGFAEPQPIGSDGRLKRTSPWSGEGEKKAPRENSKKVNGCMVLELVS